MDRSLGDDIGVETVAKVYWVYIVTRNAPHSLAIGSLVFNFKKNPYYHAKSGKKNGGYSDGFILHSSALAMQRQFERERAERRGEGFVGWRSRRTIPDRYT